MDGHVGSKAVSVDEDANSKTAPAFVSFWATADKAEFHPGTVCPLMTQSGYWSPQDGRTFWGTRVCGRQKKFEPRGVKGGSVCNHSYTF
jgi:hypothetical protein